MRAASPLATLMCIHTLTLTVTHIHTHTDTHTLVRYDTLVLRIVELHLSIDRSLFVDRSSFLSIYLSYIALDSLPFNNNDNDDDDNDTDDFYYYYSYEVTR